MPDAQIANAQGVWGYSPTANSTFKNFLNGSGAGRKPGDVVVLRGSPDGSTIAAATTVSDTTVVGVVSPVVPVDLSTQPPTLSFASGGDLGVVVIGPARINIGANTVAVGDILGTTATAGVAATVATPTPGQGIAFALEASGAKDANNTIRCYVSKV